MAFAAVAILTTLVIGIPMTLALDRDARGGALIGLSYLYGCGAVWAVLFALSLLHVRWTATSTTVTLVALSAVVWIVVLLRRAEAVPPGEPVDQRWLAMLAPVADLATMYTVATFALYATIARVWEWDFWAIWGLKGRVFFEAGGVDWRFLLSPFNEFAHPDYPLLLPMNYAYAALVGGQWDDRWMALPGIAFGAALILIVRSLAARELPRFLAALLTFAMAGVVLSQYVGLADAPLIAYGTAAILLVRRGVLFDEMPALRHGAILLGLAASTKNEGLALIASVVIAMLLGRLERGRLARRSAGFQPDDGERRNATGPDARPPAGGTPALRMPRWLDVLRLWPAAVIPLPWIVARFAFHLQTDIARGSFLSRAIERIGDGAVIVASLLRWLPDPRLWLLMLIGVVLIPRAPRSAERFVFAAVAIQAFWYVGAYFGTPLDVIWHIQTSWPRVARHLEAPLFFVVMLALAQAFKREETVPHAEARSELL